METKETSGIILFNRDYREDDKLVKIFTETAGKRMFFVKHSEKSPLRAVIQPLMTAEFILNINNSGLSYIIDYKQAKRYDNINNDIFRLAYATYIVALSDAAINDTIVDPQLFVFLKRVLELMDEGLDYEILTNIFEIQLLDRFGVSLNFNDCCFCHRVGLPFDFSFRFSGVLCPDHYHEDDHRSHVDPNVIYLINRFQQISFEELRTISVSDEMKQKLREFIDHIYDDYVGIHLKSKHFIDDLKKWGDIMR